MAPVAYESLISATLDPCSEVHGLQLCSARTAPFAVEASTAKTHITSIPLFRFHLPWRFGLLEREPRWNMGRMSLKFTFPLFLLFIASPFF
jgi:hypothetical protein